MDPIYYSTLNLTFTSQLSHHIFTSEKREERERGESEASVEIEVHRSKANGDWGHWKDKASGDRRSPCNTTSFAAPKPFILLPPNKPGQMGLFFFLSLFFFFFFFFSYLVVLIQLFCKNWILFCVLCLDYVRCFLRVKQRD